MTRCPSRSSSHTFGSFCRASPFAMRTESFTVISNLKIFSSIVMEQSNLLISGSHGLLEFLLGFTHMKSLRFTTDRLKFFLVQNTTQQQSVNKKIICAGWLFFQTSGLLAVYLLKCWQKNHFFQATLKLTNCTKSFNFLELQMKKIGLVFPRYLVFYSAISDTYLSAKSISLSSLSGNAKTSDMRSAYPITVMLLYLLKRLDEVNIF